MLSKRLHAVYKLIEEGSIISDVGTDHAKLPCFVVSSGLSSKAYAIDIKEGPLLQALKTIESQTLQDKVIPILSDGISHLPSDCNAVTICGLGWLTCEDILMNDIQSLYKLDYVIVQLNKDYHLLRKWISDHHFTIVDEEIVYDGHYYIIIKFNTDYHESYSDLQILLGPVLMQKRTPLFIEYLEYLLLNLKEIIVNVPNDSEVYNNMQKEIQIICSILGK
ncbi:MAG: class I SAM-dependent methyltransferase [Erysipelotrichaceae bacterium]|nr:class I SAM-dependent methyltransferase [Erysipelotrichaceae bacterium]